MRTVVLTQAMGFIVSVADPVNITGPIQRVSRNTAMTEANIISAPVARSVKCAGHRYSAVNQVSGFMEYIQRIPCSTFCLIFSRVSETAFMKHLKYAEARIPSRCRREIEGSVFAENLRRVCLPCYAFIT